MVKEFSLKFLHGDSDAAAHQNILEFWRRNCNRRKIAEGMRRATVIVGEPCGDFGATLAQEM
jgi:hypothetical protein